MIDKSILKIMEEREREREREKKYGPLGSQQIIQVHTTMGTFYSKDFTLTTTEMRIAPCDMNGKNLTSDDLFKILDLKINDREKNIKKTNNDYKSGFKAAINLILGLIDKKDNIYTIESLIEQLKIFLILQDSIENEK
jgi:hypothetical protein